MTWSLRAGCAKYVCGLVFLLILPLGPFLIGKDYEARCFILGAHLGAMVSICQFISGALKTQHPKGQTGLTLIVAIWPLDFDTSPCRKTKKQAPEGRFQTPLATGQASRPPPTRKIPRKAQGGGLIAAPLEAGSGPFPNKPLSCLEYSMDLRSVFTNGVGHGKPNYVTLTLWMDTMLGTVVYPSIHTIVSNPNWGRNLPIYGRAMSWLIASVHHVRRVIHGPEGPSTSRGWLLGRKKGSKFLLRRYLDPLGGYSSSML